MITIKAIKFIIHHHPKKPGTILFDIFHTIVIKATFRRQSSELIAVNSRPSTEPGQQQTPQQQYFHFHHYIITVINSSH